MAEATEQETRGVGAEAKRVKREVPGVDRGGSHGPRGADRTGYAG
ncbi:hypothetical protein AB0M92_05185 [Streptomyces sp. NPDC051582]